VRITRDEKSTIDTNQLLSNFAIARRTGMLARRHCADEGSEKREWRDGNFTPLQLHSLARPVIYTHRL
jgi:hypothetical protein